MKTKEILATRVPVDLIRDIEAKAKRQKIKRPQYVNDALSFYASLDPAFLKQVEKITEATKQSLPEVIQRMLITYIADDAAVLAVFGTPSKMFQRAFQMNENGIIPMEELSDLVYEQSKNDAELLKQELEKSVKTGKPAFISTKMAAAMGRHVRAAV